MTVPVSWTIQLLHTIRRWLQIPRANLSMRHEIQSFPELVMQFAI